MLLLCACNASDKTAPQAAAAPHPAASPQTGEASDGVPAPTATAPAAADASPAAPAVRAFVDPVTGVIREPTAAEVRALEARKQTEAPSLAINTKPRGKETVLPNGWVKLEVDADSEMKGCVQKDGRVVAAHECKSEPATAVTKP
jgi:hypothetical protein